MRRFLLLPNLAPGTDRFAIDPVAFARGEKRLREHGESWLGFAHSHPDGEAAPSALDLDELWTDCVQLILALRGCEAAGLGAFVLAPGRVARPLPFEVDP